MELENDRRVTLTEQQAVADARLAQLDAETSKPFRPFSVDVWARALKDAPGNLAVNSPANAIFTSGCWAFEPDGRIFFE